MTSSTEQIRSEYPSTAEHSEALQIVFLRIHQANATLAAIQQRFDLEPAIGGLVRALTGGKKPVSPPDEAQEVMKFSAALCLSTLADVTEWYAFTMLERLLKVDLQLALKLKDGKISFKDLAEHLGTLDEVHARLRSQVLHHFENKGLEEILVFFERHVGVPLFSEPTIAYAQLMMTARHVQVHNNGVWDQKAVKRAVDLGYGATVGEVLEMAPELVGVMSLILLANLEAADRTLIARFGLQATVTIDELTHLQDRYVRLRNWYKVAQERATTPL